MTKSRYEVTLNTYFRDMFGSDKRHDLLLLCLHLLLLLFTVASSGNLPDTTLRARDGKRTLTYAAAVEPIRAACGPGGVAAIASGGSYTLTGVRRQLSSLHRIVSLLKDKYQRIRMNNELIPLNTSHSARSTFPTPPTINHTAIRLLLASRHSGSSASKRLDTSDSDDDILPPRSPPSHPTSRVDRYFRQIVRGLRHYMLSAQLARNHEERTRQRRIHIAENFLSDVTLVRTRLRHLLCALNFVMAQDASLNTTALRAIVDSLNNVWANEYPSQMDFWAYVLFFELDNYLSDLARVLRQP